MVVSELSRTKGKTKSSTNQQVSIKKVAGVSATLVLMLASANALAKVAITSTDNNSVSTHNNVSHYNGIGIGQDFNVTGIAAVGIGSYAQSSGVASVAFGGDETRIYPAAKATGINSIAIMEDSVASVHIYLNR
ncbi:hypothetical protein BKK56_12040 [Rodentibacter genomosp. 2]|uniref:hypothetical protein n=1 Tax=Rodentibacter genomosp. 2 TaxID=1908266 RepID=UPI0009C5A664|nr:hypothetical protein BKK56_12040 [Rodentibacter genomosp. 2]